MVYVEGRCVMMSLNGYVVWRASKEWINSKREDLMDAYRKIGGIVELLWELAGEGVLL